MSTFEEHIDLFLEGELEGEARKAFLLELERDPEKQQMLEEYKRLNEVLRDNARTAAVPLAPQRALAEKIPVLKDVDPRLAPMNAATDGGAVAPLSGSGSGFMTSAVIRTLKIVSVVGVAVVGSWYGVTQFTDTDTEVAASAPQAPSIEVQSPASEDALMDDATVEETTVPNTAQSAVTVPQAAETQSTSQTETSAIAGEASHSRAGMQANADMTASESNVSAATEPVAANEATLSTDASSVTTESAIPAAATAVTEEAPAEPAMAETQLDPPAILPDAALTERDEALSTIDRILASRDLVILPVEAMVVPYQEPVPTKVVLAGRSLIFDELRPEDNTSGFVGYLESGASSSELMLTGFGNATSNVYGSYVIGLQYKMGDHLRLGFEYGRNPYSRQTITLVPGESSVKGISVYRREAGITSEMKSWLQLHGEYVFNPEDAIKLQAIGGFGSVFDKRFVPAITLGTAAGYELFPALMLRLGVYFNGAWMPADLSSPQFIGTPGQPVGIITSGETVGTKFSSNVDVRIGLGFQLW